MKKILTCCFITAFALIAFKSNAQKSTKKLSFGFGLEAGIPTGDYKEIYNFAAGITVRGSYKLGPGFITLTSGAIGFLPKSFEGEDTKAGLQIPVKAGYKYLIGDHFFVMGEMGFSSVKYYFEGPGGDLMSVTSTGFTYAPSVGAQFGAFEVGLRYESTGLSGSPLSAALVRLGFNF